jgi:intracellular multiplication protein IcmD
MVTTLLLFQKGASVMNKSIAIRLLKTVGKVLGISLGFTGLALAASGPSGTSTGDINMLAKNVTNNLTGVAKLITAGSYVAGMGFAVGAVVKFKAHKDNPTQIAISVPITLFFVAAALIFIPGVFTASGGTLFGSGATVAGTSGLSSWGGVKGGS